MTRGLVLVPVAALAMVGGCGGRDEPTLARADVAPLIALADRIQHEGPCAQARDIRALDSRQAVLLRARRVPAAFQESLASAVASLSEQMPVCLPSVAAAHAAPPAPQAQPVPVPDDEHNGRGHDKHDRKPEHDKHDRKHEHHGKHGDD